MSRTLIALGLTAWLAQSGAAPQDAPKPPDLNFPEFTARVDTALWMARYDEAAWHSSDLVMTMPKGELQKLGREWFCAEDKSTWDCFYGKYDERKNKFDVVFDLRAGKDGKFKREKPKLPSDANAFARALARSLPAMPDELKQAGLAVNRYVRRMADKRVEVWTVPAFQTNGTLVWGGDLCQILDSEGDAIVETKWTFSGLHGVKPEKTMDLAIDNETNDLPSAGQLFFVLAYRHLVKSVIIVNKKYLTSLLYADGKSTWVNVERTK